MLTVLPQSATNGPNMNARKKPLEHVYMVYSKEYDHIIIEVRLYMSNKPGASTLYANAWIFPPNGLVQYEDKEIRYRAGHGLAGGWSYDKSKTASIEALRNCGLSMEPYSHDLLDWLTQLAYILVGETGFKILETYP